MRDQAILVLYHLVLEMALLICTHVYTFDLRRSLSAQIQRGLGVKQRDLLMYKGSAYIQRALLTYKGYC